MEAVKFTKKLNGLGKNKLIKSTEGRKTVRQKNAQNKRRKEKRNK